MEGRNTKFFTSIRQSGFGLFFTVNGTEADIWHIFPQIIQDVFAGNCVAVVFVVSIILSLVLPKDMNIKNIK